MKKIIFIFLFLFTSASIVFSQTWDYNWEDPTCASPANGKLTISLSGYTGPFEYVIINTNTNIPDTYGPTADVSHTFTNLVPNAKYVAYYKVAGSAQNVVNYTLTQLPFNASASQIKGAGCHGECVGIVNVSVTGGVAPFSYNWNGGGYPDASLVNNVCPGAYSVEITDAEGCVITSSSANVVPVDVVVNSNIVNQVLCKGESTGKATVTAAFCTGIITYEWSDGSFGISNSSLTAGSHYVLATDALGCTDTSFFTITEPIDKIAINLDSKADLLCKDIPTGSASLSTINAISPIVYTWSDAATGATRSDLSAMAYHVVVEDNNQCKDSLDFTLTQPATYIVGSIDDFSMPLCFGNTNGTASLSASGGTLGGGYVYTWDDADNDSTLNDAIRTDLGSRLYSIVFEDGNGCTDTLELDLDQPDKLIPNIVLQDNSPVPPSLNCFGDQINIKVNVTGGTLPMQTYIWDTIAIPNNTTAALIGAGNYKVVVTDANNCVDSSKIVLTQPADLITAVSVLNPILCHGELGKLHSATIGGVTPYALSWSSGEITANTNDIVAGNYSFTVTDKNGCTDSKNITLTQPDTITHAIKIDADVCYDITKGTLYVETSGGTVSGDYQYLWNTNETNDTIINLTPQIYSVTVTDDNSCSVSSDIDLTLVNEFAVSFTMSPVKCVGQSNGTATASPINGTLPFTYEWSNGDLDNSIDNVPAGMYTVTITDGNGCKAIDSIEVTTIPSIAIQNSGTTETTCNGSFGSAFVEIINGVQPYTYVWSNGGNTDIISNVPVGIYTVTVTDDNSCVTSMTLHVKDTSSLQVKASTLQNKIKCAGRADGSASAIATLGTAPYSYLWSTTETTTSISNLVAGTYYIEATDDNGCHAIDSIEFIEENVFKVEMTDSSMVTCNGGNNGWALVNSEGGVAPYSISWSNGSSTNLISSLLAGSYTATITDANACVLQSSVTITEPSQLLTTIDNVTDIQCHGFSNGKARVLVTGGISPYTYSWTSGETDSAAVLLPGGEQFVTVTDSNNCEAKDSITIVDIYPQLTLNAVLTPSTCGVSDGELAVIPGGGVAPYTYSWNSGWSTDTLLQNIPSDAYTLHFEDSHGCMIDTIIGLDDVSPITADFTRQPITFCGLCNESYEVAADNGNAPYTYEWSNGDIGTIADSLCLQPYSVIITDIIGCKKTAVLTVPNLPLTVNLVSKKDVTCFGKSTGEIEVVGVNAVGTNYTYSWTSGQTGAKISNIPAGTYGVTIMEDQSICPATKYFTVTQNPELKRFFVTDQPSYCKDSTGILHLETLGGSSPFTVAWGTGEAGITLHDAWNEYIPVTISDNYGCIITDSALVSDVSDFSLSEKDRYLISCIGDSDGQLEVALDNGYSPFSYKWNHNASVVTPRASNLPKGVYTITVTDNKNCKVSYEFDTLRDPKKMNITFTEPKPIFCNEGTGTVRANVTGGHPNYTFVWTFEGAPNSETTSDIKNMTTGDFTAIATDSRGCKSDMKSYTMNEPPKIAAQFTVELTGCGSDANTGSIKLDTIIGNNPPYRFRWHNETSTSTWFDDNINRTKTGLSKGEYFFTVLDTLGLCYNVFANYTNPIVVSSIDTVVTNTHCNFYTDDELAAKVQEGSIEILNLTTKKSNYSEPTNFETTSDFTKFTILWEDRYSQTTPKADNLEMKESLYYVNITGENHCVSRLPAGKIDAFVNIENRIKSVDDNIYDSKQICLEDTIQLQADANEIFTHAYVPSSTLRQYTWSSLPANKLSKLSSLTTEKVWVDPLTQYYRDSTLISMQYLYDGCSSPVANYRINHFDSLEFKLEVLDSFDNYLGIDSVFAIQKESFTINPTVAPWYVNKPIDEDGISEINWSSLDPTKKMQGQQVDTVTNEATYTSSNIYGLKLVAKQPSYYTGIATSTHGCKQQANVFVNVYSSLFVPTGITPNNDGQNDTWIIPYLYMCPKAHVSVFNRWGVKLYEESEDYYLNPWNGTNKNGKQLPMGTYYYIIEYNDDNNTPPQAGAISIMY